MDGRWEGVGWGLAVVQLHHEDVVLIGESTVPPVVVFWDPEAEPAAVDVEVAWQALRRGGIPRAGVEYAGSISAADSYWGSDMEWSFCLGFLPYSEGGATVVCLNECRCDVRRGNECPLIPPLAGR